MHIYIADAREWSPHEHREAPRRSMDEFLAEDINSANDIWKLLSSEEQLKARSFRFARDGILYLTAHALLRLALSSEQPCTHPSDWNFCTGKYGKPFLNTRQRYKFNLSHSWPYTCVVVSKKFCCGIDIEFHNPSINWAEMSKHTFHPHEYDLLCSSAAPQKLFWILWTLKEAVVKAIGKGMSLSFDSFYIDLEDNSAYYKNKKLPVRFLNLDGILQNSFLSVACISKNDEKVHHDLFHVDIKESVKNLNKQRGV